MSIMAETERLTLSGDTFVAYDFAVFPIEANFHRVAAVYVVTRRTGRGGADEHEIVYVGETERLPEHFRDHPKAACFAQHSADCVGVLRQESPVSRTETIKDLIGQYKPPCND
jgi:hypothetical protein